MPPRRVNAPDRNIFRLSSGFLSIFSVSRVEDKKMDSDNFRKLTNVVQYLDRVSSMIPYVVQPPPTLEGDKASSPTVSAAGQRDCPQSPRILSGGTGSFTKLKTRLYQMESNLILPESDDESLVENLTPVILASLLDRILHTLEDSILDKLYVLTEDVRHINRDNNRRMIG